MSNVKCQVCAKTVYAMEKVSAEGKHFHKTCFKCTVCKTTLSLGKYASMDFKYYCKPCFKKLFFSKGNYSEGFGKKKPQEQWASGISYTAYEDGQSRDSGEYPSGPTPEHVVHIQVGERVYIEFTPAMEEEVEELMNTKSTEELKAEFEQLLHEERELLKAQA